MATPAAAIGRTGYENGQPQESVTIEGPGASVGVIHFTAEGREYAPRAGPRGGRHGPGGYLPHTSTHPDGSDRRDAEYRP